MVGYGYGRFEIIDIMLGIGGYLQVLNCEFLWIAVDVTSNFFWIARMFIAYNFWVCYGESVLGWQCAEMMFSWSHSYFRILVISCNTSFVGFELEVLEGLLLTPTPTHTQKKRRGRRKNGLYMVCYGGFEYHDIVLKYRLSLEHTARVMTSRSIWWWTKRGFAYWFLINWEMLWFFIMLFY